MDAATLNISRVHIFRIDPGEDILKSVNALIFKQELKQAVVLGGYGTLASYHLHWVAHSKLPTDNIFGKGEGGVEILSMSGTVIGGDPHIHVTLSTEKGAFGGHLEEGCTAYVLCEIYLAEIEGLSLIRERVHVEAPGMGEGDVSRLTFTNK
jgi:predicted DNA-binding protein with PD1-like motif